MNINAMNYTMPTSIRYEHIDIYLYYIMYTSSPSIVSKHVCNASMLLTA